MGGVCVFCCSHIEQQCWDGRVALQVDQTQSVGEMALSGSNIKQPAAFIDKGAKVSGKPYVCVSPHCKLLSVLFVP